MQHLRDITRWARPHDAKSKPLDIHLAVYESYRVLWTLSTIESAFEPSRSGRSIDRSNVQMRDVTRAAI